MKKQENVGSISPSAGRKTMRAGFAYFDALICLMYLNMAARSKYSELRH